jgi:hypothetical protein
MARTRMKRSLLLIAILGACHKSSPPKLADSLIVPGAKGLRVGVSTLEDVTNVFDDGEMKKDMYNEQPSIHFHTAEAGGDIVDGKLVHLVVHAAGLHDWLVDKMDGMSGSKDACPGNRKMGQSGPGDAVYCASDGDRVVFIEGEKGSDRDTIEYTLVR